MGIYLWKFLHQFAFTRRKQHRSCHLCTPSKSALTNVKRSNQLFLVSHRSTCLQSAQFPLDLTRINRPFRLYPAKNPHGSTLFRSLDPSWQILAGLVFANRQIKLILKLLDLRRELHFVGVNYWCSHPFVSWSLNGHLTHRWTPLALTPFSWLLRLLFVAALARQQIAITQSIPLRRLPHCRLQIQ
jgi:hypothetical protein